MKKILLFLSLVILVSSCTINLYTVSSDDVYDSNYVTKKTTEEIVLVEQDTVSKVIIENNYYDYDDGYTYYFNHFNYRPYTYCYNWGWYDSYYYSNYSNYSYYSYSYWYGYNPYWTYNWNYWDSYYDTYWHGYYDGFYNGYYHNHHNYPNNWYWQNWSVNNDDYFYGHRGSSGGNGSNKPNNRVPETNDNSVNANKPEYKPTNEASRTPDRNTDYKPSSNSSSERTPIRNTDYVRPSSSSNSSSERTPSRNTDYVRPSSNSNSSSERTPSRNTDYVRPSSSSNSSSERTPSTNSSSTRSSSSSSSGHSNSRR